MNTFGTRPSRLAKPGRSGSPENEMSSSRENAM